MALPATFLSEDQFTCSICLEIFNDPIATPCGHSFCKACISSYWDGAGGRGAKFYQCPFCKESFSKRPELQINRTLKEITELFKQVPTDRRSGGAENTNSHPQHHHSAQSPPGRPRELPEGIFAEMMTRFKRLPSSEMPHTTLPYPNDPHAQSPGPVNAHLSFHAQNNEQHYPRPPYFPSTRDPLNGRGDSSPGLPLCPIHLRGLEFFCQTDNTCICSICAETAEHRGHNVTSAKREWHIKKSQLGIAELELKELICEKQRKVEKIHNSLRETQVAAERETDGLVCAFSKLISRVERCQAEVLEVMEMTRRAAEHRAQNLLRELEEEIAELKKKSTALSQLALSEDYIHFLKMFPVLSAPQQTKDWSSVSVVSELPSGVILRTVNQMIERFQEEMRKLPEVCQLSSLDQSLPRPNPKIRRVQEYAVDITLDPSTAHPRIILSEDGKQVQCGDCHQPVPDNPERYDRVVCVLARQGFSTGRHYWEVEVGGKTDWDLGVASRSVNRKGKITVSPAHGYWFLSLRDKTDYAFRTLPSTILTVNPRPSRVGIYVDCDKGVLTFYNVEARMLIYTFTDTFTDTIHPFFSPCTNISGRNEAPLIICPVAMTE
ncbi:E3 ubiquitin-protein ligase TRIM39-like [Micropterus salmoides]|uniref:E3 ubiquitin-protein ligase TRIM39-like n=1 Tax=Micropterus salmoides TaxID=27706 RepID=UPI0018EE2585|nr:E3 ubiquitin-protein ligase TRIM39-like [Micropterus salmoides]